jgi:hypothetical protein
MHRQAKEFALTMAVSNIARPVNQTEEEKPNKLEAWSGVIIWSIYGLALVLVVTLITLGVSSYYKSARTKVARAAWREVFLAWKDKEDLSAQEQIAIWEDLWDRKKVSGSTAHPYVAMQLAQLHFDLGLRPERRPAARRESLNRARLVYETVREHEAWSKLPPYGALAAEGEALALEQLSRLDEGKQLDHLNEAIEVLNDAVGKYERHFLFEKMCYELGRCHWLRARLLKAKGEDASADEQKALRRLSQAVSETEEQSRHGWKQEARFLKVLLQKPGAAMPKKLPPPPEPRKVEDEDKEKKAKDGDTKDDKKDGDTKDDKKDGDKKKVDEAATGKTEIPAEKKDEKTEAGKTDKPAEKKDEKEKQEAGGKKDAKAPAEKK